MQAFDVIIVGTGHAGAQTAVALRQHGFAGSIAMLSKEPDPPYERPPLSKEYLAGEKPFERMLIRPLEFWAERQVELRLGRSVAAVRPDERRVILADGDGLAYGALVWAAGGNPRRLRCEGADLAGVHSIRTRADVDALRARLPGAARVAVIGGGYIGLEAAAVLTGLGKAVTLIEAADRLLARVAAPPLADFYAAEHRRRGVEVRTGVAVEALLGEDGAAAGVRLAGGEVVAADLVVVGIGIAAAATPLLEAGAAGGDGVDVDEYGRTSLAGIYAAGDCAAHRNRFAGGHRIRLESVQNAHDQANVVARAIMGSPEPYRALPWFWSNQYDLRLQTAGLGRGFDDLVVRGDPGQRSFSMAYLRQGRLIALDAVNAVKDYVQARKLILDGAAIDRARLADPSRPLKDSASA
ncbi:MAG TPA: FAD-dependent oxidoreductase [Allosphingosinicella sp.]|nr:FAD-dependent oxidoreductase [Allosphingosinicella sp.]